MLTLKVFSVATIAVVLSSCLIPEKALASRLDLTAEAIGSSTPSTILNPSIGQTLQNSDFTIEKNGDKILGNGIDEQTSWSFDFSDLATSINDVLQAELTLDLTPNNVLITTDVFGIIGLDTILIAPLSNLSVGTKQSLSLNLLEFYDSGEIVNVFNANSGKIPVFYGDDAIVSGAKLSLSTGERVPEPASTLGILALGALGISSLFKHELKQQK
ncbi:MULTISPECIES: PEP-CTERM sorting domain-containing protein [unclassified Moorena]|uniref:PEP-CTERM sorting domain-containing protein n=1 Tax=unclassified Moorena TaxID=2683338 RepID=UPI0013C1132F|nr:MULTISPECIES: PEP-CTERM sorting domain-containing protein [unclassified Moorena]NEQ15568.1 PEP-CTERM sorting domain-containing protein [Moorena sp. SIO3E2]NES81420.1 PEP-CTERM sorting domain-containing protein [Moorena sp. SIO2B7]NEP36856.1 PEP-CTERM sorting domain-containing protein [Moorena sp. SIO3B2]NEP67173.1 PEP-CTERM sorting domain-containing protein [Moorena sp. SIO3A5]NET67628.1 PEP-CTERM sorting domain-containing protein [Moorena sp. SIO1G6]